MNSKRTYYDILRVAPDAETEVISAAHKTLMSKLKKHPDLGGDPQEAMMINRAYQVLSNPDERKLYDSFLERSKHEGAEISKGKTGVSPAERRRVPRDISEAVVSFCFKFDFQWHSARVKDVSALGIRIQAHVPFAIGQNLVIAPTNVASAAMHGTVKWCRMFHPSIFERVYEAGVEFSDQITDVDKRLNI